MTTGQVQNFFALLDLPESCNVDEALLERNYRTLQTQWHPDRFAAAAPPERLAAVQQASLLNDAYSTLKTPLRRAEYLLQMNGVDPHKGDNQTLQDGRFLMEQLEQREELEDMLASRNERGLKELRKRTREQQDDIWRQFSDDCQAGRFGAALRAFHKLQFLNKLGYEIVAAEDKLLDEE
jgi:molecular chaperone HscB